MKPFFSIVMPAYKAEKYIADTLASIGKQTFSDWECIVVEDGSPDRTKEIVREAATKDSRIRLIEQPKNCGVSEARNRGIQEADGLQMQMIRSMKTCLRKYINRCRRTGQSLYCLELLWNIMTGRGIFLTMKSGFLKKCI